jgi:hypothetical protein
MRPHRCSRGPSTALLLAVAPILGLAPATFAGPNTQQQPSHVPVMGLAGLTSLSQFGQLVVNPAAGAGRSFSVLPLNAPPINGFNPQVVYGLSNEQDRNDFTFESRPSSNPGGNYVGAATLPIGQNPKYFVATLDTGSQAHLITYNDSLAFDLDGANRLGNYQAQIQGVNGVEDAEITDALGIYATSFSNASVNANTITATPGTLKGQWQTAILTAEPTSALPNLIGSPMIAQYQTVIRNSQTRHLSVGSTTFRSPNVSFQALNTAMPAGYSKLTLNVQSANGVSPNPVFFPSFDDFDNLADNPTTPSFWGNITAVATAQHTGGSSGTQDFLFDTGAEVSVVSEDTAASVGFFTGGPDPTPPDFFVDVTGVGGTTVQVPGFYMDSLRVTTNGGPITWTHVPVLVLNIPDPRDGVGFIPGVLGMNLFTDRDLVINGGTGDPWVAIGPQITSQWTSSGGGAWSDDTKWSLGSPNGADVPANFLSSITSPSTITVDSPFTVGSIKFDNVNRYTIAGPGTLTLQAFSTGTAAIQVVSGSHTISAPLNLLSNTVITVTPATSTLTINGPISAGTMTITKLGAGAAEVLNVRSGALNVNAGTMSILTNGTSAGTSRVGTLTVDNAAAALNLNDNDLIVTAGSASTITAAIVNARHNGAWDRGGITSSAARTQTSHATTLGVLRGVEYKAVNSPTFDGFTVADNDVLVKYTWYGDTDFNGRVNFDDYVRTDNGFNTHLTGWLNGDFDLNGNVNFDDYVLIDLAFNTQSGTLGRALSFLDGSDRDVDDMNDAALRRIEDHFQQFGDAYARSFIAAVPEPATMLTGLLGITPLLARRRRNIKQMRD